MTCSIRTLTLTWAAVFYARGARGQRNALAAKKLELESNIGFENKLMSMCACGTNHEKGDQENENLSDWIANKRRKILPLEYVAHCTGDLTSVSSSISSR